MAKNVNSKAMSKNQFLQHFSEKFDLKKNVVKEIFDEFANLTYEQCKHPKGFAIPGLGKMSCKLRKARMGRNPRTGESIKIPAKKVVKFRIAKAAKEAILGTNKELSKKIISSIKKKKGKKSKK